MWFLKQKDKQLHFIVGFFIVLFGGMLFNLQIGLLLAIIAAIGKEVFDSFGFGTPEFLDIVATLIGAAAGTLVFQILKGLMIN